MSKLAAARDQDLTICSIEMIKIKYQLGHWVKGFNPVIKKLHKSIPLVGVFVRHFIVIIIHY